MRYAFSMMRITDTFRGTVVMDTSTITDKSTACPMLVSEIKQFIKKTNILKDIPLHTQGYIPLSNKAGPNGPCTLSCLADLTALKNSKNKNLYKAIQKQLSETIPWIHMDTHDPVDFDVIEAKTIGIADKFCKTRLISIAEF